MPSVQRRYPERRAAQRVDQRYLRRVHQMIPGPREDRMLQRGGDVHHRPGLHPRSLVPLALEHEPPAVLAPGRHRERQRALLLLDVAAVVALRVVPYERTSGWS